MGTLKSSRMKSLLWQNNVICPSFWMYVAWSADILIYLIANVVVYIVKFILGPLKYSQIWLVLVWCTYINCKFLTVWISISLVHALLTAFGSYKVKNNFTHMAEKLFFYNLNCGIHSLKFVYLLFSRLLDCNGILESSWGPRIDFKFNNRSIWFIFLYERHFPLSFPNLFCSFERQERTSFWYTVCVDKLSFSVQKFRLIDGSVVATMVKRKLLMLLCGRPCFNNTLR